MIYKLLMSEDSGDAAFSLLCHADKTRLRTFVYFMAADFQGQYVGVISTNVRRDNESTVFFASLSGIGRQQRKCSYTRDLNDCVEVMERMLVGSEFHIFAAVLTKER